jgi:hypothetical protein
MSPKKLSVSKGRKPTHLERRHSADAAPPAEPPPAPAPSAPPAPVVDPAPGDGYLSREQQLQELLGVIHKRDQRLARAFVDVFTGASPRVLASFGRMLAFVARESERGAR